MSGLIISQSLLWIAVMALAGLNLLLIRQIGILHERIAPVGALAQDNGIQKGTVVRLRDEYDIEGKVVRIGGPSPTGRSQLIFFAAPDCPVCKTVLPATLSLARYEHAKIDLILASAGGQESEHLDFVRREKLFGIPYVLSDQLGMELGVSKLPYAVLISPAGTVSAFGLVNTREHLESLIEAEEQNVASLQEYRAREMAVVDQKTEAAL